MHGADALPLNYCSYNSVTDYNCNTIRVKDRDCGSSTCFSTSSDKPS
jgi:hypothetical protein